MASLDGSSFSCSHSRCAKKDLRHRYRAQFFNFRTGPVDKASRGDSLELNDSTNSDDDREQLSTRALYQAKLFGAYENGLFESGTGVFNLY